MAEARKEDVSVKGIGDTQNIRVRETIDAIEV